MPLPVSPDWSSPRHGGVFVCCVTVRLFLTHSGEETHVVPIAVSRPWTLLHFKPRLTGRSAHAHHIRHVVSGAWQTMTQPAERKKKGHFVCLFRLRNALTPS